MVTKKTIKTKLSYLTRIKESLIQKEFDNFQLALHGQVHELYSATSQQADRLLRKLKGKVKDKYYPMILRLDTVKVEKRDTKISKYWLKIPIAKVRGGIWCALDIPKYEDITQYEIRECKVLKKNGDWFVYITVQKEIQGDKPSNPVILGCDIGEKVMLTSVMFDNGFVSSPKFYGREIRKYRRHYAWLRKRLGNKKLVRMIKKIGSHEKRIVRDICHKISRSVVNQAKEIRESGRDVLIVVGDIKNHRKGNKGRRFNRIRSAMPSFQMKSFLKYKALWEGIPILFVNEAYTSKTCSRCNEIGTRKTQGLFVCQHCGFSWNADLNGSCNISFRGFLGYVFGNGVDFGTTHNLTSHAVS